MPLHVVRPKILGFISEEVSAWLVALLVLLAGGILTGLLAWSTYSLNKQQLRQRFQLLVSERYSRIEERFQDQEQRLDSLRRFFVNSDLVTRQDFEGYAKPLLRRTQAYAWAPLVSRAQRAEFERSVRSQGQPGFSIMQLNASGQINLSGKQISFYASGDAEFNTGGVLHLNNGGSAGATPEGQGVKGSIDASVDAMFPKPQGKP